MSTNYYAEVKWVAEDVKKVMPEWSLEKCEEWLADHEDTIQEIMIERGWNAIQNLITE